LTKFGVLIQLPIYLQNSVKYKKYIYLYGKILQLMMPFQSCDSHFAMYSWYHSNAPWVVIVQHS